jgi:hypothetical protein
MTKLIEQIVEATVIDKVNRKISTTYTQGLYRVTVQTRFFSNSKAIVSTIRESRLEIHDNYSVEISELNIGFGEKSPKDDYNERVATMKIDRYNFKKMQELHNFAVADANDSLIITQLLLKGKTNSELFEGSN